MGWNGPLTNRQYLTWLAWLREDYNRPSRNDYYVLRAGEANCGRRLEPLKFGDDRQMSKEEHLTNAKARAKARAPHGVYTPPPVEAGL